MYPIKLMLCLIMATMLAMSRGFRIAQTIQYTVFPKDPNLCVNCKHFIPSNLSTNYGKCRLYPRLTRESEMAFLVDGNIPSVNIFYLFCTEVRNDESMCGKDAVKYEQGPSASYPFEGFGGT